MTNFITGINGFAASHLADCLLANGEEVSGVSRNSKKNSNVTHIQEKIKTFQCDIGNLEELKRVLEAIRPEKIYHLAAQSFVPTASDDGAAILSSHFFGTFNLLEAAKHMGGITRVLWVGSAEEYGESVELGQPINEDHPLQPDSLYGVGKASADLLAQSYFKRGEVDVVRVRPFNHIGPRQDSRFAVSSFSKQISEIEKGESQVIKTGNLDAQRDFTDVRDTVRAYFLVMEKGISGEVYNVCSGKLIKIKDILDRLVENAKVSIQVETEPARVRSQDQKKLIGDFSKLTGVTGWKPEINLETTLIDILNHWRLKM